MIAAIGGFVVPHIEYTAILPELILLGVAIIVMTVASLSSRPFPAGLWAGVTAAAGAASLGAAWYMSNQVNSRGPHTTIAGAIAVDGYSEFFLVVLSIAVILGALVADNFLRREGLDGPEFYVLAMVSAAGAMFMSVANDLIVVFLGLETLSIALYVLAGYNARRRESHEAALKYFVLGSFSSAIFLYGVALTYGATGSTNLARIGAFLAGNVLVSNGVLLGGLALLIVGLGFKVAAVPFHSWSPDVYQGSPTPVTGYMAAAAKAAGFAGLLRVLFSAFGLMRADWQPIITVLAAVTLVVGAVLAVVQTDIKRLLAYSSINHAGFVLVGLAAASAAGLSGSLFYLLVYTFMVIGSFGVVTLVGRTGDARHRLDDYRGLARERPIVAAVFALLLLAQAGVPFTTGFLGKFYVIAAAVDARSYPLAILAILSAVVGAFYYLRVVLLMYSDPLPAAGRAEGVALPPGTALVLVLASLFTVAFGLVPGPIVDFAHRATLLF
ncbi:MAG TPA: NADH-quinone oxidoreductase subunit N [Acidimicrobiales bacterium]|nr:NADH-quinone oxidoreductase subunit N [Acidimicrobiales bacterium]